MTNEGSFLGEEKNLQNLRECLKAQVVSIEVRILAWAC